MNRQDIIDRSLNSFEIETIDVYKLAEIADFSAEEIEFLNLFSEYLLVKEENNKFINSEKINLEWLDHDNKSYCISLINKKISKTFIENVDYVKIDHDKETSSSCKLYNITFECLKSLLVTSRYKDAKKIRLILLKIEDLVDILSEVKLRIELKTIKIQHNTYVKKIEDLELSYNTLVQQFHTLEEELHDLKEKQKETLCVKIRKFFGRS